MTLLDLANSRKTARMFKQDEVKPEDVKYILESARQAPIGSNAQPWRFIVIIDVK